MVYKNRDSHKIALYKLIQIQVAGYPVAKKKLENTPDLPELIERVRGVEEAMREFCDSPLNQEYLRLKFWGPRMEYKEMRKQLGIGYDKMSEWRNKFLTLAGKKLGLLDKGE